MGDKQSRPVESSGQDGEFSASQHGESSSAAGAAAEALDTEAVPSESEILARLVTTLGHSQERSLAVTEIQEKLPPALQRVAGSSENIVKWLRNFQGLLEVTGAPGEERVLLTLGRPPNSVEAAPNETVSGSNVRVDGAAEEPEGPLGLGAADDESSPSTVQLRGLPFRATVSDIKAFLGENANNLITYEPAIRLLLNRDGRPSGFARVQFVSPEAARGCRESLHRQLMGDRYVEVLACSERAGKVRHRRAPDAGDGVVSDTPVNDASEQERVLQECREQMWQPGRHNLLLSMLGIALSPPTRAYLRRANLGLKHFLARFPNEFRVEGPKGCERVIWCHGVMEPMRQGVLEALAAQQCVSMDVRNDVREPPTTPKVMTPAPKRPEQSHCVDTPSVWGTPDPFAHPISPVAAPVDFSFVSGQNWPYQGWFPPFAAPWQQPWTQPEPETGRRNTRADAPCTRSHAHLHPQSHPFAHRPPGADSSVPTGTVDETATSVAALRLRGLPFSVTVQDVLAFFAQHDVADRIADGPHIVQLLPKANGRPSGQAVVQMRSRADAEFAQRALQTQYVGGRYIEVFVYGDENDNAGGSEDWRPEQTAQAAPWTVPPWPQGSGNFAGQAVQTSGKPAANKEELSKEFSALFHFLWNDSPLGLP
uniref:RRM domain-containing protein n=1 Tax=Noctiluca scintillans TaxID=2966 RepID=A0A7S1FBF7_NOCSC